MPSPFAPVDPLTGLEAARFGLYIHFPYCLSKCPYCDFASVAVERAPGERYALAVLRELELRAPSFSGAELHSGFLGGGTPSLWEPSEVARVLLAVGRRFPFARGAEVTLEANPGAADAARFTGYRAAGVNRLSMGVQSFEASTLHALGRGHDGETAERAYSKARGAGFENVSLDFIYGVQGQTLRQVRRDAERAAEMGPEHLSAYALTLDKELLAEEVPLARAVARGEVKLPSDGEVLEMAHAVREVYAGAGYARYEISNYARAGYHSRHNALYWTGGEYLALGAGATGFFRKGDGRGVRYSNPRSPERYLQALEAGRLPEGTTEALGPKELFAERVAMGLRLTGGVDLEGACRDFGEPVGSRREEVERLIGGGLAQLREGRLALTLAGADLHSAVSARLI
ncbi:MAG: radical SAM family heme chaperone HemW [Myxococcaceae bacterium]